MPTEITDVQRQALTECQLKRYIESWEQEKGKFLKSFDTNPEYAIEWHADYVIAAQVWYVAALEIMDRPEGKSFRQAVDAVLETLNRTIRRDVCTSTSPTTNAVQLARRRAQIKLLEALERDWL